MKKKSAIGALFMAAAILVSVPLGVNRSFARMREEVEGQYYLDLTGYAIWDGIDKRVDTAKNLLTVAERYTEQDPELDTYMDNLERAALECENTHVDDVQEVGEIVERNARIGEEAQKLADRLETLDLSEKDAKYPRQLMADLDAEHDKIQRSSYNDEAIAYNNKLEKFPVNYLQRVSGLEPLGIFGPGSSDRS